MNYSAIIKALRVEVRQIDRVVAQLEALNSPDGSERSTVPQKRRGRKSMGEAERQQVSDRMKRYWAAQRKK